MPRHPKNPPYKGTISKSGSGDGTRHKSITTIPKPVIDSGISEWAVAIEDGKVIWTPLEDVLEERGKKQ